MSELNCPKCSEQFTPSRTNQRYCSKACQKNGARQDRFAEYRLEKRRDEERIHDLTDSYIRHCRPESRIKFVSDLIQAALRGNRDLKRALSYQGRIKNEDGWGQYPSIGKEIDPLCRKACKKSSLALLNGHKIFNPAEFELLNYYPAPPPMPEGWDYRNMLNPPPAYKEPEEHS